MASLYRFSTFPTLKSGGTFQVDLTGSTKDRDGKKKMSHYT